MFSFQFLVISKIQLIMKIKTFLNNKIFPFLFLSFFITSCSKKNDYFESSKDAIDNVLDRFPTLIYSKDKNVKIISERKLSINNDSIEINLIKFEGDEDENKVLVFKNKENHYYAIPLFSTLHRDYWEFKNDVVLKQFPLVNSTFVKEFSQMYSVLKFERNYIFREIVQETFSTVSGYGYVFNKDDLIKLEKTTFSCNYHLIENEDSKESHKRVKKNIDDLSNLFNPKKTYLRGNGKIIEFDNIDEYLSKNKPLKINCYRQDQNVRLYNL